MNYKIIPELKPDSYLTALKYSFCFTYDHSCAVTALFYYVLPSYTQPISVETFNHLPCVLLQALCHKGFRVRQHPNIPIPFLHFIQVTFSDISEPRIISVFHTGSLKLKIAAKETTGM